jgi:hypothetical protein
MFPEMQWVWFTFKLSRSPAKLPFAVRFDFIVHGICGKLDGTRASIILAGDLLR